MFHCSIRIILGIALSTAAPGVAAERLSVLDATPAVLGLGGQNAQGTFLSASFSKSGRYVAFSSNSNNIAAGVTGSFVRQGFRTDRNSGSTVCFTLAPGAIPANSPIENVRISANGRCVVYLTAASNLGVPANGFVQAIWQDLTTGQRKVASLRKSGGLAGTNCESVAISGDGKTVAFLSNDAEIAPGSVPAGTRQVYAFDPATEKLSKVSFDEAGDSFGDTVGPIALSHDGSRIAFASYSNTLTPGTSNNMLDVFVWERATKKVRLASPGFKGEVPNGPSLRPALSKDGRFVAFTSGADNLVKNDPDGKDQDIFVHDLATGVTKRMDGFTDGDAQTFLDRVSISGNGRYVVCLATKQHPSLPGVTLHLGRRFDFATGTTDVIEIVAPEDAIANDDFVELEISANGKKLLFMTNSTLFAATGGSVRPFVKSL